MRWKRWLWIGLVLTGIVGAIAWNLRSRPVEVEAAEVKLGPLEVTVEEEGKTRVTDRYVVSAPAAGYSRRIALEVGDVVRKGQMLCVIEPARAAVLDPRTRAQAEARVASVEASLRASQQQVAAAEADARFQKDELARLERLMKTGDVPRDRYDRGVTDSERTEAVLREARDRVRVAESEVRSARAALEYSAATTHGPRQGDLVTVIAEVAGRVLAIPHKSEGPVNAGEPLIEIGDTQSLEVVVELLSTDAVKVARGTPVVFTRWGGEKPLDGRVRTIEPAGFTKVSALGVEEQRVTVIVDVTSPRADWQRLGAGYRVEAAFVVWRGEKVLHVPASALFRYEGGWAVFTIEGGLAKRRKIEVGHRAGLIAEIISGIDAGATVIDHPDTAIEDGSMVTEKRQTP